MTKEMLSKEMTILIIDDEPVNVRILENYFEKEGFSTIMALSGDEGISLAKSKQPALILLDIMMPGKSGFETCREIVCDPDISDIPVIFLSAMDDVGSKVKGLSMGSVDYITKPFEKEEVLARTRLHIKLRQARRALIENQRAKLMELREAQQAILTLPDDIPDANFSVSYTPLHETGGDFYDVVKIGKGIFGYFIADVSGHDIRASFLTSALKALIIQNSGPHFTHFETMYMINSVMRLILKDGQHLTACYAYLNRLRSKLIVINAGHPPVIYISRNGDVECLQANGDILGAFDSVLLGCMEKDVSKGDRFFLYTDGMIECSGEKKMARKGGIDYLISLCIKTMDMPPGMAVNEITRLTPAGNDKCSDDFMLIGVDV